MQCPHCLTGIHEGWKESKFIRYSTDVKTLRIKDQTCPECHKLIIVAEMKMKMETPNNAYYFPDTETKFLYPDKPNRTPIPKSVPNKFSKDYFEAVSVLCNSPNASAALSRRVLQHVLRDKTGVSSGYLNDQIKEARKKENFHPMLKGLLDYVRQFGNFGTHPIKDDVDKIIDVDPAEAEAMLEIIEALFDYYYLQPDQLKKTKDRLDQKVRKKQKARKKHDS